MTSCMTCCNGYFVSVCPQRHYKWACLACLLMKQVTGAMSVACALFWAIQVCLQLKLMTSWAVVCDVYFLPPQTKGKDESSQQFAERVQKLIAHRAKLHVAPWDGYLKYYNLGDKVTCRIKLDLLFCSAVHTMWHVSMLFHQCKGLSGQSCIWLLSLMPMTTRSSTVQ